MAAHGGTVVAGASGNVGTLDTGNLNVTGTDLALVCGGAEEDSNSPTMTLVWDPAGNNESMTGTFATIGNGAYLDMTMAYLDDPTAANAPVRLTLTGDTSQCVVFGTFPSHDRAPFVAFGTVTLSDEPVVAKLSLSVSVPVMSPAAVANVPKTTH